MAGFQQEHGGRRVAFFHRLPVQHVMQGVPLFFAALLEGFPQFRGFIEPPSQSLLRRAQASRHTTHRPRSVHSVKAHAVGSAHNGASSHNIVGEYGNGSAMSSGWPAHSLVTRM